MGNGSPLAMSAPSDRPPEIYNISPALSRGVSRIVPRHGQSSNKLKGNETESTKYGSDRRDGGHPTAAVRKLCEGEATQLLAGGPSNGLPVGS